MKRKAPLLVSAISLCVFNLSISTSVLSQQPAPEISPKGNSVSDSGNPASLEFNERGVAAIKAKDFKSAEHYFRKALEIDSGNLTAAFNLAGALISNQKHSEAIALLNNYTARFKQDAGLFARLGDAYFSSRKTEEAKQAYLSAVKINPDYPGVYAKLGTIATLQNRTSEAQEMYEKAVAENPKDSQSLSNLAAVYLANGAAQKAIPAAKRALQLRTNSELYVTLGAGYEILHDYNNALIAFQRAADLGDKRPGLDKKIEGLKKAIHSKQ